MEDYYDTKIDQNLLDFPMIQETVKKKRSLRASIDLFNKPNLTYSSVNYLFVAKVSGAEMRQKNDN